MDRGGYIIGGITIYFVIIFITLFILSVFQRNKTDKILQNGIENLSLKEQIAHICYLFSKCKIISILFILYLILCYYIVLKLLTISDKFILSYTDIILGVIIYLFILFITYSILNNITITEEEKEAPNGIEKLSLKGQIVHIWHLFNKCNLLKKFTILYILVVYCIIIAYWTHFR